MKNKIQDNDSLFTVGAFIKPFKVIINNKQQWRWIVTSFEDETFLNGSKIDVYTFANSLKKLLNCQDSERENQLN